MKTIPFHPIYIHYTGLYSHSEVAQCRSFIHQNIYISLSIFSYPLSNETSSITWSIYISPATTEQKKKRA